MFSYPLTRNTLLSIAALLICIGLTQIALAQDRDGVLFPAELTREIPA